MCWCKKKKPSFHHLRCSGEWHHIFPRVWKLSNRFSNAARENPNYWKFSFQQYQHFDSNPQPPHFIFYLHQNWKIFISGILVFQLSAITLDSFSSLLSYKAVIIVVLLSFIIYKAAWYHVLRVVLKRREKNRKLPVGNLICEKQQKSWRSNFHHSVDLNPRSAPLHDVRHSLSGTVL